MDAVFLKMRLGGHVRNVAVHTIVGINLDGHKRMPRPLDLRDRIGQVLAVGPNELKNRGVRDVLIFSVDNLGGISEAIEAASKKWIFRHREWAVIYSQLMIHFGDRLAGLA